MSSPLGLMKGALRALLLPLARRAARQRHVKRLAQRLLRRMPALERRVRALVARKEPQPPRRMHVPLDSGDLSPATHALYEELKHRFDNRKS